MFCGSRQDRPAGDERSDLVGVDQEGKLLVTELKRGELSEDAVIQVLGYAAEYGDYTPDELAELYHSNSLKQGNTRLMSKATSILNWPATSSQVPSIVTDLQRIRCASLA